MTMDDYVQMPISHPQLQQYTFYQPQLDKYLQVLPKNLILFCCLNLCDKFIKFWWNFHQRNFEGGAWEPESGTISQRVYEPIIQILQIFEFLPYNRIMLKVHNFAHATTAEL